MAIVCLALNGDGLGHLVRTSIICEVLESAGERPVIFSQGMFPLDDRTTTPGMQVPSLWSASEAVRRGVSAALRSMAEISLPAIVVEDTHPNPISLPSDIRRVLLVRPTTFEYLMTLKDRYGSAYSAFLVTDAPESPTWPYSEEETRSILNWNRWHVLGPVYRTAAQADIVAVRQHYQLDSGQRLCVFNMGGGGQHRPTDLDAERFLAFSKAIGAELRQRDPDVRLVFVKGPYFPGNVAVDEPFETVAQHSRMPALFAAADGAVIRTGFNSTWECLAASTPFIPFIGTTYAEPTNHRLERLAAAALVATDVETFWCDFRWRDQFEHTTRGLAERWSGKPDRVLLRRLIAAPSIGKLASVGASVSASASHQFRQFARRGNRGTTPLVIRIDDVVSLEPTLHWLLRLLAARRLRASLEVVPYLSTLDDSQLDPFDPMGELFEVSQHGYAHIPRAGADGRRFEFSPDRTQPDPDEERAIIVGKASLGRAFPKRFSGGFSPPFDAAPAWIDQFWFDQGGTFVSRLFRSPIEATRAGTIRAGVDIWGWSRDRGLRRAQIVYLLNRQARADGHIGLVLHPRCLRKSRERARLIGLLNSLQGRGTLSVSLRQLAVRDQRTQPLRLTMLDRLKVALGLGGNRF
jgi:hypothetical protein